VSSSSVPLVGRSNTSFFQSLAQSDLFSPSSRDLLQNWADSPREGGLPSATSSGIPGFDRLDALKDDPEAPPILKRVASGDVAEVPKITRSMTSFINEMAAEADGADTSAAPSSTVTEEPGSLLSVMESIGRRDSPGRNSPGKMPPPQMFMQPGLEVAPPPPVVKRGSSRLSFGFLADLAE